MYKITFVIIFNVYYMSTMRLYRWLYAVAAILMMITEGRTFTLDVGQSLRLECEFYMDNFDMFDNPVIWKKSQHGSTSTSSQINTMRNIHRPFVGTGRFDVTLMSAAPRYHLQLGIASKSRMADTTSR